MRKLVLIADDLFVRSFLQGEAFASIEGEDTYFVASEEVTHREELEAMPNYLGVLSWSAERNGVYYWVRYVLQAAYRFRSRTMQIKTAQLPRRMRWRTKLNALPGLRTLVIARWMRRLGPNRELHRLLEELRPDIVICPSAGTDALVLDAIHSAQELGIRTLVLVNGWDNLSSKTGFFRRPDYLGVWGEQSVQHAIRLHGMRRERVFALGVPTFRHHFDFDPARTPSPYEFPYVLFAGCALAFDELSALRVLDSAIEELGEPGLQVVYRPHPWRHARDCPDIFREEDFRNVVLDMQVRDSYLQSAGLKQVEPSAFLPSLEYYPGLLGHARCVICPLSTMTVEAAIVDRPVVVLAYDDHVHEVPPSLVAQFDHFEGIERVEGFEIVRELPQLAHALRAAYAKRGMTGIRQQIRPWLYFDERTYDERLAELIAEIEHQVNGTRRAWEPVHA